MNTLKSRGIPLKGLGIKCIAFGTDMYLAEWCSSLLLTDMMESIVLWIRAYPVKDGRESEYSSELTTPPSPEDTGSKPVVRLLEDGGSSSSRSSSGRSWAAQCLFGSPKMSTRCVLVPLSGPSVKVDLRLVAMATLPRAGDINFEVRFR
jgi:hypothetical protein